MNPLHPKLRQALLNDKLHKNKGLTASRLKEYEQLAGQLFYTIHYPERPVPVKDLKIHKLVTDDLAGFTDPDLRGILSGILKKSAKDFSEPLTADELIDRLMAATTSGLIKSNQELIVSVTLQLEQYQITPDTLRRLGDVGIPCSVQRTLEKSYIKILGRSKTYYSREEISDELGRLFPDVDGDGFSPLFDCYSAQVIKEAVVNIPTGPLTDGPTKEDLREDIRRFQETYMPNYRNIHASWAREQLSIVSGRQLVPPARNSFLDSLNLTVVAIYRFLWKPLAGIFTWPRKRPGVVKFVPRGAVANSFVATNELCDMPVPFHKLCLGLQKLKKKNTLGSSKKQK